MEILGYIVQHFYEEKFLPETGYKHLIKTHSAAMESALARLQDYITAYRTELNGEFEYHSPTKMETDSQGYSLIFRNTDIQIWIEVVIA